MEQKNNQDQEDTNKKGFPDNSFIAIIIVCLLVFYVVIGIYGGTG